MRMTIAALALLATATMAMTPYPKPEPDAGIETGRSAPFVGQWSVSLPTMDAGKPDVNFAICKLPVRIEAIDDTHITYLGPRDRSADEAIRLAARDGGTDWKPVGGGPSYFAIWVAPDLFYLYDEIPDTGSNWVNPFVYRRCP